MKHTLNQYIKEVYYYFDDDDDSGAKGAIKDIQKLLAGKLDIKDLRKDIEKRKIKDEAGYGDDIYKK